MPKKDTSANLYNSMDELPVGWLVSMLIRDRDGDEPEPGQKYDVLNVWSAFRQLILLLFRNQVGLHRLSNCPIK